MAMTERMTFGDGLEPGRQIADEAMLQDDKNLVGLLDRSQDHFSLAAGTGLSAVFALAPFALSGGRRRGGLGFGRRLGLGGDFGALGGQLRVDGGRFRGVNFVVILVRLGELLLVPQQRAEAVGGAQLVVGVHLDGVEGADLDADLAAHADGNVDVENLGIELRLADGIRLLVRAFFNEDALRRAFFFADEAGDAAQACCQSSPS